MLREPYKGLGFRNIEAEVAEARYKIEEFPIAGRSMNMKKIRGVSSWSPYRPVCCWQLMTMQFRGAGFAENRAGHSHFGILRLNLSRVKSR